MEILIMERKEISNERIWKMNECYITNKVRLLLHEEQTDLLPKTDREKRIQEIMDAFHFEIQASAELLERKIMKMLNLHLNDHLY